MLALLSVNGTGAGGASPSSVIAQAYPTEYRNLNLRSLFSNAYKAVFDSLTIKILSLLDRPNEVYLNCFLCGLWTQTSMSKYLH